MEEDVYVLLDRKKIERIVNNYLGNALKFTPKAGRITMEIETKSDLMKIKVSDNGKGVDPTDLPHIFKRFYQSKQADRKLYGGTGIGLALVNEFAILMGGHVYAESELGKGSQFYFELPLKIVEKRSLHNILESSEDEEEIIESIGYDFKILVVEDNYDMRDFIQQLLMQKYSNVYTAQNGAEGLAFLRNEETSIDLIISDVMMPEVDGLRMVKELKADPILGKIPVIMLTALAAERDKLNALTIGVDDYLTKLFSVSELLVRAQNILYNYTERRRWQKVIASELQEENKEKPKVELVFNLNDKEKEWVDGLEQAVKNTFHKEILSAEQLAATVFISQRQLSRKLKALIGLTPGKFIKEIQLSEALKQLEDGNFISIKEVSLNCGFENQATFSTVFKKRFGKSPSDYLQQMTKI